MDFLTSSLFIILSLIWICILWARKSPKLPPGPYGIPIIGNILHLGPKPHLSLAKLARKYGPVMSLKLGSITTIVISSPETARVVLKKHDSACSGRAIPSAAEALGHHEFSMAWLPVERQWRRLRKVCKDHMFSGPRLDASRGLRREKLRKLHDYVSGRADTGRAVDVGEAAFATALNLMSASLFSTDFAAWGSESSQEMKELIRGVMESVGSPNLADYFPVLKAYDPQGVLRKTRFYFEKLFGVFDEIIEERLRVKGSGGGGGGGDEDKERKGDMVEALIEVYQRDEAQLSKNDIRHLLLDLFVAGSDTTAVTVEWAMTELMRNPTKMAILQNEVRSFIQENGQIQESDIPKLPYLQAVVKETFRLHPAAPFLVPHKASSDVEITGHIIPKNSHIIVNIYASGRDPTLWPNPDEFLPERFLNHDNCCSLDFRGQDFELIPFGAGRRICPGLPLADRMLHQMLVTFVADFDWKLEGIEPQEIDMNERFGITLQKVVSLKAIPRKRN